MRTTTHRYAFQRRSRHGEPPWPVEILRVELAVDEEGLAARLAASAALNRTGKARLGGGLIVARIISRTPADPPQPDPNWPK